MQLVGQYDSPYTRRVAISLTLLRIDFEQLPLSLFSDFEAVKAINPLVRIPALILENGEVLLDSAAILDYLDEQAGNSNALIPTSGKQRRTALQIIAIATGAIDKAMAINYERNQRPEDKIHTPWIERLSTQLASALTYLDNLPQSPWLMGKSLSQADITTASMLGYIKLYSPDLLPTGQYKNLYKLSRACEALPAFKACLPIPENLGGDLAVAVAAVQRLQNITK